jgi:hypothetical protein
MRSSIVKIVLSLSFIFTCGLSLAGLAEHESTCSELGFKKRTPAYGECVLELDQRESNSKGSAAKQTQLDANLKAQQQAQQAQLRGDGTVDHQTCNKYGFAVGTATYSDCRLKIDLARQDAQQRHAQFEAEQRRYQEKLAAYEKETERRKGEALLRLGLGMMGGGSSRPSASLAPTPPVPPAFQQFNVDIRGGPRLACTSQFGNVECR